MPFFVTLLTVAFSQHGFAAGTATAKPAAPPTVNFSTLSESASLRPDNSNGEPHQAHARLLSDKDSVAPGETFRVGLHLAQDTNWHTYWKSPGDIGLPTYIEWSLPDGATNTEYSFPIPQRFEHEGIVSFGYEDEVLFFTEVTLPLDQAAGVLTIGAKADWLVCEISCIKGEVELTTEIRVGEDSVSLFASTFDHYALQHPVPLTDTPVTVSSLFDVSGIKVDAPFKAAFKIAAKEGHTLQIPTSDALWPTYTAIAGDEWMINNTRVAPDSDGNLVVVVEAEAFAPDPLPENDQIGGLFQVQVDGQWYRFETVTRMPWVGPETVVQTDLNSNAFFLQAPADVAPNPAQQGSSSLLYMMLMALVGGLLLNIMPCVLPVLTMKLYGLVEQSEISAKDKKAAGLAYTAGILASFVALAIAVVIAQKTIGGVGWGFQFQYPPYVATLATIVFAFGLSLFGVFEIPAFGEQAASDASAKEGPMGYFVTGVFATLVATPCSAPFLGTALGFAFAQPPMVIVAFFAVIGFGLALPFLLVSFVPTLFKLLPQPGQWMVTFKQLMGFTLMATTVWLVDVLGAQIGATNATAFLGFLTFVALGCWVFGNWGGLAETGKRQLTAFAAALLIIAFGASRFLILDFPEEEDCGVQAVQNTGLDFSHEVPWQPFSNEAVASLSGKPIFIDFTADWCLSCKVNEKTILETDKVRKAMATYGTIPLKADWTRRDEEIGAWLTKYGRAGVPFYLVIPADPNAPAISLGEVITPTSVINALKQASGA